MRVLTPELLIKHFLTHRQRTSMKTSEPIEIQNGTELIKKALLFYLLLFALAFIQEVKVT